MKVFFKIVVAIYKNVSKILSKNKEKLSKKARERYKKLLEDEKWLKKG